MGMTVRNKFTARCAPLGSSPLVDPGKERPGGTRFAGAGDDIGRRPEPTGKGEPITRDCSALDLEDNESRSMDSTLSG